MSEFTKPEETEPEKEEEGEDGPVVVSVEMM